MSPIPSGGFPRAQGENTYNPKKLNGHNHDGVGGTDKVQASPTAGAGVNLGAALNDALHALDVLGVALADIGHKWTDEQRSAYERAVRAIKSVM